MATIETSLLGLRTFPTSGDPQGRSAPVRQIWRPRIWHPRIWHQWGAIAIAALVLPACVNTKYKTNAPLQAYAVADEPRAAQVGREILDGGGTAADAVAAMALTMSVTLPSRVGLAGGGVCVVFDAAKKETRTLDFLPRTARPVTPAAPGLLRAMAALQATTGAFRWEQVVVPAEVLAANNPGISRAFAEDLAANAASLTDAEARRIFQPAGRPLAEGSPLSQPELAALLGRIRLNGFGALYGGNTGDALATAVGADTASLRARQPRWGGTASVPMGSYALHFPDLPEQPSGKALAAAWTAGMAASDAQRVQRALAALPNTGAAEAPAAGVAAMDGRENAVACALTMGAPFGTGSMVPGTGLLTARGVQSAGFGAPAVISNSIVGRTILSSVGTAKGGDGPAAAAAALFGALLPVIDSDRLPSDVLAATPPTAPGRADIIGCRLDPSNELKGCQAVADPRGRGVAHSLDIPR